MSFVYLPAMLALLAVPAPLFAKKTVYVVEETDVAVEETTVTTEDPVVTEEEPVVIVDGPLLDKMSDSGALYGDLYRIARYKGGEIKNVPLFKSDGTPDYEWVPWVDPDGIASAYPVARQKWTTAPAVGGEPILTEEFAVYTVIDEETGDYVLNPATENIYYPAPLPSQCVQPVADAVRWGDISEKSHLSDNRIPLMMTYDATWKRTECEPLPELFLAANEPFNDVFVENPYHKEIYWADLVQEVEFGRLNLARAPEAVLDASFDEAIRSLNNAIDIKIDPSGRLMVTTDIFDEFLTNPDGTPLKLETVVKAIDSPKENLALYQKLMRDGHLITTASERAPIDYSLYGGIPINKLLDLVDGPSDAPRPTINIDKMISFGLGHLVDAGNIVTYYIKMEADGSLYLDGTGNMVISSLPCAEDEVCVEFKGVVTPSDNDACAEGDFPLAASFFSAAADKAGNITTDKIVYINSILGINKVVGYSAYDADGNPLSDAINYAKNPVYFNYNTVTGYDRLETFGEAGQHRGRAQERNDDGSYDYDGMFEFLEETSTGNWVHTADYISKKVFGDVNVDPALTTDIGGFTSMSDDDLQVIVFTHTYQIPGLR